MRYITSIMLNFEVSSFGAAGSLGSAFSGYCYYFGKGIWGTKSLGIGMTIFVPGITVLGISGSGAFFYCCSLAIGLFFAFLLLALLVLYGALLYIFASFFCSQASLRYSFSTYLSCLTSYLVLTYEKPSSTAFSSSLTSSGAGVGFMAYFLGRCWCEGPPATSPTLAKSLKSPLALLPFGCCGFEFAGAAMD